jgi:transaldolase
MKHSPIAKLPEFGQSPWYDNLTRAYATGGLRLLMERDGIRGVTSNPTIYEKALGAGDDYDEQLGKLAAAGTDSKDAYWELVTTDIRHAADLLRPVFDENGGADGFVSIEVDPDYAHETGDTVTQAAELFSRVGRPNVMIKIPGTRECLPGITETIAAGINVNVTLIFALARHAEVIEAYVTGLEQLAAKGGDLTTVNSVASFFVSRVDTETDRRLPEGHALRGKAAVANAKLAYQLFERSFAGERWDALAAKGARPQRPLWASTSTKNPAYSPTLYVDELIGPNTVNTLAQASIDALQDHQGLRPDTVTERVEEAGATIAALKSAGVDFDDVTDTLEREGVASFSASFHDALDTLTKKARELARARTS